MKISWLGWKTTIKALSKFISNFPPPPLFLWSHRQIFSVSTDWPWYWEVSVSVTSDELWPYPIKTVSDTGNNVCLDFRNCRYSIFSPTKWKMIIHYTYMKCVLDKYWHSKILIFLSIGFNRMTFQRYICMVPVSNDRMARVSQLFLLVKWPETVNNTLYHYSEAWSKTEVILYILTFIATMYNRYCAFLLERSIF